MSRKYPPTKLETRSVREKPASMVISDPTSCLTTDILAVLIGGRFQLEIADRLMQWARGDLIRIYNTHPSKLSEAVEGLGIKTALKIKAALALAMKAKSRPDLGSVSCPADISDIVSPEMDMLEREQLWVLLLDQNNKVLEIVKLYQGSLSASTVRVAEIIKPAIEITAAAIALVHNHPSGSLQPSAEDVSMTSNVVRSASMLDIRVLDHLIIGRNGSYTSLKEKGLGGLQ